MSEKELFNFMSQLQSQLASEYERIQSRVNEDAGTAGDQVEENWAELLRSWLPANYQVVTKGRIVNLDGESSPQVDILVLSPAYPKHLINKKYYLAGGVVAAFECKLTIRTTHISSAFKTGAIVKNLIPKREGTPYKELCQPIIYGLLAHSHKWKGKTADVALGLISKICDHQFNGPQHPSELLDVICIADLGNYSLSKGVNIGPGFVDLPPPNSKDSDDIEDCNHITTSYTCAWANGDDDRPNFEGNVLGSFLSNLFSRLAYEDSSLRTIADYYIQSMEKGGIGFTTTWTPKILSNEVARKLKKNGVSEEKWSEWHQYL